MILKLTFGDGVFTQGDYLPPKNATALDFAFSVHTDIGVLYWG